MQLYLLEAGYALLKAIKKGSRSPLPLTGSQIGSDFGFEPTASQNNAVGSLLVDNRTQPQSVRYTLVGRHEIILSVHLDQTLEFDHIGNAFIYLNDNPLLALVSPIALPKKKIDNERHFSGDEYYLAAVFRYPYIRDLLALRPDQALHATFLNVPDMTQIPIPEQSRYEQIVIGDNGLPFGGHKPAVGFRVGAKGWYGNPLINTMDRVYGIDGGSTVAGE